MLWNQAMVIELTAPVSSRSGTAVEIRQRQLPGDLEALHAHLVLRFRAMADEHLLGCAFVAPYSSPDDSSPSEILVIPDRTGAPLFTIGFLQDKQITMVVRIGEHGVFTYTEDDQAIPLLAVTAESLFSIALSGRYREEVWTRTRSGRYEGGQSYYLDGSQEWQELGPRTQPPASSRLLRHLSVQDHHYEPY